MATLCNDEKALLEQAWKAETNALKPYYTALKPPRVTNAATDSIECQDPRLAKLVSREQKEWRDVEAAAPSDDELEALVSRLPAPKEWYDE
jgi:hypothetical protein